MALDSVLLTPLVNLINAATKHVDECRSNGSSQEGVKALADAALHAAQTIQKNSSQVEGITICEAHIIKDGDVISSIEFIVPASASELQMNSHCLQALVASGYIKHNIKKQFTGF